MGVLQKPPTIGLLLGSEQLKCFVCARVRWIPNRAEVLQSPQHVVVPAGWKGELQLGRIDNFAGAPAPEQLPFEEVLLTAAASC